MTAAQKFLDSLTTMLSFIVFALPTGPLILMLGWFIYGVAFFALVAYAA